MQQETLFARRAFRAYQLYAALAERENDEQVRIILEDLAHTARDIFDFWARKLPHYDSVTGISSLEVAYYRLLCRIFGISHVTRQIIKNEERAIAEYVAYCATCASTEEQKTVRTFMERLSALIERLR